MALQNLIPSQPTGKAFLAGSHFTVANDNRIIEKAMKTTFHRDYPPPSNTVTDPAVPHVPADFMHRDLDKICLRKSETTHSYPEKRAVHDDQRDKYSVLYKTHFKMDADERIDSFQTTAKQYFKPKNLSSFVDTSNLGKNLRKSHIPQGDKEKAENPLSIYKYSFPKHDVGSVDHKFDTYKLWSSNTITGDNQRRFATSHNSAYTGISMKPPAPYARHTLSSIPDGDQEKLVERMSTATHSYQPHIGDYRPFTGTDPYTKLYATTFTQKDGHGKFNNYRSTVADTFKPQPLYEPILKDGKHRNHSNVPGGDMDPNRVTKRLNYTTSHYHHKPINTREAMPYHVNGSEKRTASNVQFGRNELASRYYDTTCDTTYQPVSVPYNRAASHPKSVIPLKYYDEITSNAATADDFREHDIGVHGAKHVSGALLQRTHFDAPLGQQRYFSTTHASNYVPMEVKKTPVDTKRLQLSSLPISTLGKYIEGSCVGW